MNGVVATQPIFSGENILTVPDKLMITEDTARAAKHMAPVQGILHGFALLAVRSFYTIRNISFVSMTGLYCRRDCQCKLLLEAMVGSNASL